jgi:hypothetical protein
MEHCEACCYLHLQSSTYHSVGYPWLFATQLGNCACKVGLSGPLRPRLIFQSLSSISTTHISFLNCRHLPCQMMRHATEFSVPIMYTLCNFDPGHFVVRGSGEGSALHTCCGDLKAVA